MVKIPPAKGVKWTLWWGALDYWRLQVRGLKLLVSGEFNFKVENCFGFLNMPLSGLDGKGGLA